MTGYYRPRMASLPRCQASRWTPHSTRFTLKSASSTWTSRWQRPGRPSTTTKDSCPEQRMTRAWTKSSLHFNRCWGQGRPSSDGLTDDRAREGQGALRLCPGPTYSSRSPPSATRHRDIAPRGKRRSAGARPAPLHRQNSEADNSARMQSFLGCGNEIASRE